MLLVEYLRVKLSNRWDRWYDFEKRKFIPDTDFQPEENLNHAMIIVDRLEQCGYTYTIKSPTEKLAFQ